MKLLIKGARIIDPKSKSHNKVQDILVLNGKISSIKQNIPVKSEYQVFKAKNLHVSPGWVDLYANFADPGFEQKEDLESGTRAAAAGGYTSVACNSITEPALHSKSEIEYVRKRVSNSIVDVYPVGAVSRRREGEEITEMYDMHAAGAVAFSDADHPIKSAGLMMRSLLYVKPFDGVIYSNTLDETVAVDGIVNEGKMSTRLGLRGIPDIAEELMVMRDIYLAEYTSSRVHFTHISTKRSTELIKAAKSKGIRITASVAAHQLILDDSYLAEFDSNYKVAPPLRTKKDISALIKGLIDGTIDAVCSQHSPHELDAKKVEFDQAAFGIIGLETAYPITNTCLKGKLKVSDIIDKFTRYPREILKLEPVHINRGQNANLTLFDPALKHTLDKDSLKSRSRNTPFLDQEFIGKALGIVNHDKLKTN